MGSKLASVSTTEDETQKSLMLPKLREVVLTFWPRGARKSLVNKNFGGEERLCGPSTRWNNSVSIEKGTHQHGDVQRAYDRNTF